MKKLTPKQVKFYKSIIKKYAKEADKYFQKCKIIPDTVDLANCIYDFWNLDSPSDLGEGEYQNLLNAMKTSVIFEKSNWGWSVVNKNTKEEIALFPTKKEALKYINDSWLTVDSVDGKTIKV